MIKYIQLIYFILLVGLLTDVKCYKSFKNDFIIKIFVDKFQSLIEIQKSSFQGEDNQFYALDLLYSSKQHKFGIFVVAEKIYNATLKFIDEQNFKYNILKNEIDEKINLERKLNRRQYFRSVFLRSSNSEIYYYMRYNEIKSWLLQKTRQTDFMELEILGNTVENREIILVKISKDKSKPIIWIDGGIHAREWISPSTAMLTINNLIKNSDEANKILRNFQIYILPLLNPDGYEYSHQINRLWRKNRAVTLKESCVGVDLNRNFPYHWGGAGASNDYCSPIFRGEEKMSENETKSVVNKLKQLTSRVKLFVTLHSFGQYILTPYGYSKYRYTRNYYKVMELGTKVAAIIQEKFGRFYRVGSSANLMYEASGASDDFAAGEIKIPYTYTIELPDRGRYGFILPPTYIKSVGNQFWKALSILYKDLIEK